MRTWYAYNNMGRLNFGVCLNDAETRFILNNICEAYLNHKPFHILQSVECAKGSSFVYRSELYELNFWKEIQNLACRFGYHDFDMKIILSIEEKRGEVTDYKTLVFSSNTSKESSSLHLISSEIYSEVLSWLNNMNSQEHKEEPKKECKKEYKGILFPLYSSNDIPYTPCINDELGLDEYIGERSWANEDFLWTFDPQ